MATNIPMIEALEKYASDILQLLGHLRSGHMPTALRLDELEAWTRLLQQHLRAQKKLGGQYPNDTYSYNPKSKEIERRRGNKVVSTI